MNVPRNLVSDSLLIQETLELARANGGRVGVNLVTDRVFRLANVDASLSALLVSDLLANDPRFRVTDDRVEVLNDDAELRLLNETEFVVLDIEAMTIAAHTPRIIDLAAYRVRAGTILDDFQTLINPGNPVSGFISALTGITNDMLRTAPAFAEVAHSWLAFAGDAVLVAHNATFDVPLLNQEIGRVFPGYRMRNAELCTVNLARRIVSSPDGHKLDSLANHFAIPIDQRHRAAGDARATAEILLRLLAEVEQHGVTTLAQLRNFRIAKRNGARPNQVSS